MTFQQTMPVPRAMTMPAPRAKFCTGFGQYDTHSIKLSTGKPNTAALAGKPYTGVTEADILAMVGNPPSVAKTKAQWFIPSDYRAHDGRDHEAQRQHGQFWAMPLDLDENNLALDDVRSALVSVAGDARRLIHSSRSSLPDQRRWRALNPLAEPIAGADYADTMTAFYDLLEEASVGVLIPDRGLARPGQIVYLPNRGEHYEHDIHKGARLHLTPDHPIIQRREETRHKRAEAEAKVAEWKAWKARQAPTDTSSIVGAFNSAETIANLLAKYGYRQARGGNDWRSPMQSSGSYATRDYGDHWTSLSGSDGAAGIGRDSKTGGRHGDAFDLFVHFEHGGDFKAAVQAYALEIGQDYKTKKQDALARLVTGPGAYAPAGMMHLPEISPAAERLATRIAKGIRKQLPVLTVDPAVDALIIRDMIEGAFWSGAKMRMFLLIPDECLVQFVSSEAWKFLCKRFGSPVDADEIIKQLETDPGTPLDKGVEKDARKAINDITAGGVVDYLKYENQRDSVEWVVDMFGTRSRLELKENAVRIVLTHRTLAADGKVDPACVADYRAHFPLLDEVLEYIVAARFALDRKKAFIWLFAASDWGKDFLMGALRDLGLVVETSVKEVEAAFEGKPSGMSATEFKRAFILAMNEFKTVKSEIKQLGSYLELSPKNQLRTRVQIYTKMFMSAESVPSLVGENGVEDQFANRMSMIKGDEKLTDRALYKADQGRYFRSVRGYVAGELNRLIGEYQALGLEGAERCADTYLSAFLGRHGVAQYYGRLSASYPTVADQAVAWIRSTSWQKLASDGGYHYLTHATKVLDDYLAEHYNISEVGTLRRRKDEIMVHMSDDGRGNASHRIGGKVVKAVKLKS